MLSGGLAYSWSKSSILAPILFTTLLLLAFANYYRSENNWISSQMDYPEDLSKEFSLTVVAVGFGIVVIAIVLPVFSINSIVEIAYEFTHPQIAEVESVFQSIGLKQSSFSGEDNGGALRGGFPRGHLIGSGPELSEQLVMTVKITGGLPKDEELYLNLPLYWRSLTYDEYLGSGWRSTDVIVRSYKAGEGAITSTSSFHQAIQQDFQMAQGKARYLFAAGDIITTDEDFKIVYRPTPQYTEIFKSQGDFFGASIDQSAYRVQSLIPIVNSIDLSSVQGDYPIWIQERYLTLPDTIPVRVFDLAKELTKNDRTPYDKVRSLETHLRSFEYTLDVEALPVDADMVDFFLYDLKKGYCDYYATTMAVMTRGIGIPARLATGYFRGTYDKVNGRYIVTEADAHSWVEVYFQDIGWVPFEPTAGRASLDRLTQGLEIPTDIKDLEVFDSLVLQNETGKPNWTFTIISVSVGLCVLVLGYFMVDNIRMNYLNPLDVLSTLYQRFYRHGTGLRIAVKKESTPFEFAESLGSKLLILSDSTVFRKILTNAIPEINEFTNIYSLSIYSSYKLSQEDGLRVLALWKSLRRRLAVARFRQITYRRQK
jgi:transglutaminase-like putative cysteine protease